MKSLLLPFLQFHFLLLLLIIIFSSPTRSTRFNIKIPRLSPTGPTILLPDDPENAIFATSSTNISDDLQTFFYNQTLDHFNYRPESYTTFQQRYLINNKYWGGINTSAPIFVYLGAEAPIDGDPAVIGFLTDNAPHFNALLVYIEHRYYGKSIPFGSREEAMKNASTLGYFNSAQAIADYAEIILHIKQKLNAEKSPVIVIGGSYGGMLASWFRLKYPHIALGALASSAPILYFDDITPQDGYYSIVTKDFKEASETCYRTIKKSWSLIDEVASQPDGLSVLSNKFRTCNQLEDASELKNYLDTMYCSAAQYNKPPTYPVTVVCGGIDGGAFGDDILSKIFGGVVAYKGNRSCYVNAPTSVSETGEGWRWQTCSEMLIPIGRGNETMFPPDQFDLELFVKSCKDFYGVPPRPHWVTTYYGGHNIKLILERFGSNIIFSNGLRDPYSRGGVLENISGSVVAIHTVNGSHCLDILKGNETDPKWLIMQRNIEIDIIEDWISTQLEDAYELKNYLDAMYSSAAQYNKPPTYPVTVVCGGIDGGAFGDDILSKIFGGVVAYKGNRSCYVNAPTSVSETGEGWRWQTCSEMVMPIGRGNETMFPPYQFDLELFVKSCKDFYGVPPRPHWVTTYYGGHNIKLILERFGSNIIFSNGLRDPYSSGGVLENISGSVVAIHTVNGSHCLDILKGDETDPEWLVMQRNIEIDIIEDWISMYYADLLAN